MFMAGVRGPNAIALVEQEDPTLVLDNQWGPYALVLWDSGWSLTASHEGLEMLADPSGRRFRRGLSPKAGQGQVQFLVEACDPCEADRYAYVVNRVTAWPLSLV